MGRQHATLEDARNLYAAMMVAASGSSDPRLLRIFETVPREAFLPPGPWTISVGGRRVQTPTDDPIHLYQNALVALDVTQGINNGEPHLHAAWLGAIAPKPDDVVTHIGAGTGYYSAILSMLVLPRGTVTAFEIDAPLAEIAKHNLAPFENVVVTCANATEAPLAPSDVIYVNAGVIAPPVSWLSAMKPDGRLIFPWRPAPHIGVAICVTRTLSGFEVKPLMPSYFIPCVGASEGVAEKVPDHTSAWRTRSIWLIHDRTPDESATAIYADVWFSDQQLAPPS